MRTPDSYSTSGKSQPASKAISTPCGGHTSSAAKDGDLDLNDVDRSTKAAARAAQAPGGSTMGAFTSLALEGLPPSGTGAIPPASEPVNANAPGVSDADINAALVSYGLLSTGADWPNHPFVSGELDCGGLTYCSAGGTGVHLDLFQINPEPFPSCCDANGNGFGSLDVNPTSGMGVQTGLHLLLAPHATADQIRAGDVLLIHATCKPNAGGGPFSPCQGSLRAELTTTLASVFATVPALASYTDSAYRVSSIRVVRRRC